MKRRVGGKQVSPTLSPINAKITVVQTTRPFTNLQAGLGGIHHVADVAAEHLLLQVRPLVADQRRFNGKAATNPCKRLAINKQKIDSESRPIFFEYCCF